MKNKSELVNIGQRVRDIRKTLKLTQENLAKQLAISTAQVSEVENGTHPPGYFFLKNIAGEFNVNLDYILFGKDHMFKKSNVPALNPEECLVVKKEIIQKFQWYLYRSPTVQHLVLAHFNSIMRSEKDQIQMEINDFNKKIKNGG